VNPERSKCMTDIEILDEIESQDFDESIKREAVKINGVYAVKLTLRNGTVKHVRNLAIPTETLAGEPF